MTEDIEDIEEISLKEFGMCLEMIRRAKADLGPLTRGQQRDLLADNTPYNTETIAWIVETIDQTEAAIKDWYQTEDQLMPKFEQTYCSQCGQEFGPGDSGFSHCTTHRAVSRLKDLSRQLREYNTHTSNNCANILDAFADDHEQAESMIETIDWCGGEREFLKRWKDK